MLVPGRTFDAVLSSVFLELCVLLAVAPPSRGGVPGFLVFIYGFLASELPFLALYYIVASTVHGALQSNVNTPMGQAAVGLAAAAVLGTGVILVRELQVGAILDRALAEGLGAAMIPRRTGPLPWARILICPVLMRRRDVRRVANISYGDAGRHNRLDVYQHRSPVAGAPVFVHFHGGGMVIGNKNRESLPLLYHLASQGWVCISANYRLRDAAQFTDHLIDVKRVIAWIRQHGAEYGANPETLILSGTSAGGQLSALAGFTQNDRRFQPGFERADTSVSGVVCLGGFYGFPGSAWSPLEADTADAPPFLIVHGKNDSVVPVEYARLLARKLRRESPSPVVYAELPGAQHAFDRFHTISFDTIVTAVESFAAWAAASRGGTGARRVAVHGDQGYQARR